MLHACVRFWGASRGLWIVFCPAGGLILDCVWSSLSPSFPFFFGLALLVFFSSIAFPVVYATPIPVLVSLTSNCISSEISGSTTRFSRTTYTVLLAALPYQSCYPTPAFALASPLLFSLYHYNLIHHPVPYFYPSSIPPPPSPLPRSTDTSISFARAASRSLIPSFLLPPPYDIPSPPFQAQIFPPMIPLDWLPPSSPRAKANLGFYFPTHPVILPADRLTVDVPFRVRVLRILVWFSMEWSGGMERMQVGRRGDEGGMRVRGKKMPLPCRRDILWKIGLYDRGL